jgi:hypothetical protein
VATEQEDSMAFARVVAFDGVSADRMRAMKQEIEGNEKPEGLPATELMILHDPGTESALAILFFDSEDDYAKGDEIMNAMPADDTPGHRTSVTKYEVGVRMTV